MAINYKKIWTGVTVVPKATTASSLLGELETLTSNSKLHFHNGTSNSPVVTEAHAATLTNKTLTSPVINTGVSGTAIDTDPTLAADSDTLLASQKAVKAYVDASSGDVQADVDDLITLSGVPAGSTDLGTFIGTTIPDGSDNKEAFQALESGLEDHINDPTGAHTASAITNVPSGNLVATDVQGALNEIQTEVDGKVTGPSSAADEAIARFDGTTGKLVQDSIVKITDAGVMTGLTGLTSSGTVNSTGTLIANGDFVEGQVTDSTATGANATITNPASPFVRLTNASLTSVDMISTPVSGEVITIENATGNTITINNNTGGTAANRILTGTKGNLTLADEASIILKYDSAESRWMVIGGTGSGSSASLSTIFQLTGTDVPLWSTGNNATFLGGGSISGTFVADTSTPMNGVASYVYTQAAGSLNDYAVSPAQFVAPRFRGVPVTLVMPYTYNGANNDIEVIIYDATNAAIIPNSAFYQVTNGITIFKTNVTIPLTCTSIRVGFHVKALNSGKILAFDDVQLTADNTVYAQLNNNIQTITSSALGTTLLNRNLEIEFNLSTLSSNGSRNISIVDDSANTRTKFIANVRSEIEVNFACRVDTANTILTIQKNGSIVMRSGEGGGTAYTQTVGWAGILEPGDFLTFATTSNVNNDGDAVLLSLVAKSASNNIVTAPDTFSSDTATLTYAGSSTYTLSTLANAPVGTFITFTYAANTNTRTQTNAAAPTQTSSSINANGIFIDVRAYNATSGTAIPTIFAIQIGKGMKGVSLNLYKSTGKVNSGSIDFSNNGTIAQEIGMAFKEYNESTGVLVLDAGFSLTGSTNRTFYFSDATSQTNGYITINASKNPALTGLNISAVAARGVNSSGSAFDGTGATLTYNSTKTFDTHGALNTTTGVFTCPDTGYYQVSTACQFQTASYSLNQVCQISFVKNGVEVASNGVFAQAAATFAITNRLTDIVFLTKGDTLSVSLFNTRGSTALNTNAIQNFFSITKTSVG